MIRGRIQKKRPREGVEKNGIFGTDAVFYKAERTLWRRQPTERQRVAWAGSEEGHISFRADGLTHAIRDH